MCLQLQLKYKRPPWLSLWESCHEVTERAPYRTDFVSDTPSVATLIPHSAFRILPSAENRQSLAQCRARLRIVHSALRILHSAFRIPHFTRCGEPSEPCTVSGAIANCAFRIAHSIKSTLYWYRVNKKGEALWVKNTPKMIPSSKQKKL